MSDKLATIYIWITMAVSVFVIAVMLLTGNPEADAEAMADAQQAAEETTGSFYAIDETIAENSLEIMLPATTEEQHVTVENDYMNRRLLVHIAKQAEAPVGESWFYGQQILVNADIEGADLKEDENAVSIVFPLNAVFEWESKYEKKNGQSCLYLQLTRPKEKYEKIVVLDAGHGGTDTGYLIPGQDEATTLTEKALALAVVTEAGKLLEKEGICVYYTRQGEENPSQENRVALANETQADMLISVHADYSNDTSLYGMRTIYNETYFIPNFASADLAYLLLEKVAAQTNEKAIGFEPADGDSFLIQNAMVPVAQLNVGYLSNKQEQKLLSREDYIGRIASGICEAVKAGYREMEK